MTVARDAAKDLLAAVVRLLDLHRADAAFRARKERDCGCGACAMGKAAVLKATGREYRYGDSDPAMRSASEAS